MRKEEGMVTTRSVERRAMGAISGAWWAFLVTGILWLLVALVVLRFDVTSLAAVGTLLGVTLLMAGVNEFVAVGLRNVGWRWAHGLLGVLFVVGGIWAFVRPIAAFWELASILGFLLMLKGSFDIIGSVAMRGINELWWLGLLTGILEVLLAFWVSQQFFAPRAALIILWVGFGALFRGISEIALAFELRGLGREVRAA
jgi:uncharacterized membrane protein HdeD (DUF308 family)